MRVLSIDGGGVLGMISAMILGEIEKKTGKHTAELFDLIAGTSTGGILALGLTKPDDKGLKPFYSASAGVELYEKKGGKIFSRSLFHMILAVGNLLDEKYPSEGIDTILQTYFGDTVLAEALTDVLIPAYDIERRTAHFFKSEKSRQKPIRNFFMRDIARATSAAPTFFEPAYIQDAEGTELFALIDGGVFANNPAMCAYAEIKRMYPEANDIFLLSLGTGGRKRAYPYRKAKDWGTIQWSVPILDVMFDGVADTVDYQLERVFIPNPDGKNTYHRLMVQIPPQNSKFDDASADNIATLKQAGFDFIQKNQELLDRISQQLTT